MEWAALLLTIVGTWAALAAHKASQQKEIQEKKSRLLDLHSRNVVELDRLLLDLDAYTRSGGVLDQHFMQGMTYAEGLQMLHDNRVKLMEVRELIEGYSERMPATELEENIRRLNDNLHQFEYIRNFLR